MSGRTPVSATLRTSQGTRKAYGLNVCLTLALANRSGTDHPVTTFSHEEQFALPVPDALSASAQTVEAFLRSNELWGGAGSIADQPFDGRSIQRKELERLLIRLGRL